MKTLFVFIAAIVFCSATKAQTPSTIQWTPLDQSAQKADVKGDKNDKLIFIDFYTDWCGWCKRLDQSTYTDARVIDEINKYFVPVKFDAEGKDDVKFNGRTYSFIPSGSRGTHQFAIENCAKNGRIGYPTITILTPDGKQLSIEPGYKDADNMLLLLKYYGEGFYKTMNYQDFINAQKLNLMAN